MESDVNYAVMQGPKSGMVQYRCPQKMSDRTKSCTESGSSLASMRQHTTLVHSLVYVVPSHAVTPEQVNCISR